MNPPARSNLRFGCLLPLLFVVHFDAGDDAVFAFGGVMHPHRDADFHAQAHLFIGQGLPGPGDLGHLFPVTVGHGAGGFLHDERLARHVFGDGAVAGRGRDGGGFHHVCGNDCRSAEGEDGNEDLFQPGSLHSGWWFICD